MKKSIVTLFSIVCLVAMLLSFGAVGHAETAKFESTQTFMDYLDAKDIKYSYYGVNGKHEEVDVEFEMDNFPSTVCELYFKEDCEEVSLRVWNIVTVSAGKNFTYSVLNKLNDSYKFAKFVLDESDDTVQAEIDMYIDAEHCGRPVYDAMMALVDIIDDEDAVSLLKSLE